MFTTAVRVERDLGVPSVSFNTLTGHRSCAPEDCSELVANSPQGPVPVSGVFPVGAILHLLETRLQAVWLSPCRADPPARHPIRLGMDCRFSWHAVVPDYPFRAGSAIRSRDISSRLCPLRGRYTSAPHGAPTTTGAPPRPDAVSRQRACPPPCWPHGGKGDTRALIAVGTALAGG